MCETADVVVDNLITGLNADVDNPQLLNGTCANFLPFRTRLQQSDSVEKFLKVTQAIIWETTDHGTVGLHDIYKALGKNRRLFLSMML